MSYKDGDVLEVSINYKVFYNFYLWLSSKESANQ